MRKQVATGDLDFLMAAVMSGGVSVVGGHVFGVSRGSNWPELGPTITYHMNRS